MSDEPSEPPQSTPAGPTGKAAEYVQSLITEGFKREFDQEENVVRSLPFFATSIGVLITFLGFIRLSLPPWSWELWPVFVNGLLAGLLLSLLALLIFLFQSVRPRTFEYPMTELALLQHSQDLTEYYRKMTARTDLGEQAAVLPAGQTQSPPVIDARPYPEDETDPVDVIELAVIDDLRIAFISQLAESARVSRTNNASRFRARGRAFLALMCGLTFALALIVAILTEQALYGGSHGQDLITRTEASDWRRAGCEVGTVHRETNSSAHAGSCEGGLELPRSKIEGRPGNAQRESGMSGKQSQSGGGGSGQSSGGTSNSPSASPAKPATPPMTPSIKSQDGGSTKR
jgi:hypothetical protein